MKTCSTISRARAKAISAASTPCCVPTCSRRPSRRNAPDGHEALLLQKPPRGDARQFCYRPVVDIGPGIARTAVVKRHLKHPADIFGRLGKTFAAGFIHVELAQQRVARAQAIDFAEHDVVKILRQHQPRIMFDAIEPALASGFADEVGALRPDVYHRMVEAAHQRAVDEKAIGDHSACYPAAAWRFKPPSLRR